MAESEEELKSLLRTVKEERASAPSGSGRGPGISGGLFIAGQPGAQLVHLHSGAQAAWRSPMWSTADVCRRERRQSSELRTGFLLKATHGPPLHTAWERAGYMAAPNFNR